MPSRPASLDRAYPAHWDKRSQAAQAEEIERTPLRRVAEAADQANVICFLASSDADFVTASPSTSRVASSNKTSGEKHGRQGRIHRTRRHGRPMALNLAKAGHKLVVHDIDQSKTAAVRAQGAELAGNAEAVAAAVERTILIVETTDQAEAVIAGERGIIKGPGRPHRGLHVDHRSLRGPRARRAASSQSIAMVDAPVSGGTGRAQSGELSVIVGGDKDVVAKCEDLFKAMGNRTFHVGPLGNGLAMKLVNNMLVQVNTVAVAEALVLGVKRGSIRKRSTTSYASRRGECGLELRVPRILKGDYEPGGTIDISYKDQELETAFAKRLGVPVLLANVTQQVYQMARAQGLNKQDGSAS